MSKRTLFSLCVMAIMALTAFAGCGGDPPTATPTETSEAEQTPTVEPTGFDAEWASLIEAAQEEGTLNTFICCGLGPLVDDTIAPEFREQFGVRIINSTGSSREQADRIIPEREAGQYTLDVWIGGVGTNLRLIEADVLDPIGPLLIHPEVLDKEAWFGGDLAWADPGEYTMAFVGDASVGIAYNTDLVPDPRVLQSYRELLDPEWNGKMVFRSPREIGTSGTYAFYYRNPQLGPDFLRSLITETDAYIASNGRQATDRLAQGLYSLCLFSCSQEVENAREQGLPVQEEFPHVLAEGARLSEGGNALYAVNQPPHPAAQQLFVNWWLSREGQIAMQEAVGSDSLRLDIPKDMVDPANQRVEGGDYIFELLEPNYAEELQESTEFVNQVMDEAGL